MAKVLDLRLLYQISRNSPLELSPGEYGVFVESPLLDLSQINEVIHTTN